MNMTTNISKHPCTNKCPNFKGEQCKTCLVQELPSSKEYDSEFLPGDVVVLIGEGTNDVLLEIVNHMYTPNMYRVKILGSRTFGPAFKDDIRHATVAEIQANRRLTNAELSQAEVS